MTIRLEVRARVITTHLEARARDDDSPAGQENFFIFFFLGENGHFQHRTTLVFLVGMWHSSDRVLIP